MHEKCNEDRNWDRKTFIKNSLNYRSTLKKLKIVFLFFASSLPQKLCFSKLRIFANETISINNEKDFMFIWEVFKKHHVILQLSTKVDSLWSINSFLTLCFCLRFVVLHNRLPVNVCVTLTLLSMTSFRNNTFLSEKCLSW